MNNKTAKLLKKFCKDKGRPYKAYKKLYAGLPINAKMTVKQIIASLPLKGNSL